MTTPMHTDCMQSEFPTIAGTLSAMADGGLKPAQVLEA